MGDVLSPVVPLADSASATPDMAMEHRQRPRSGVDLGFFSYPMSGFASFFRYV